MKKIISLLLVIALTASVAIGGTMAYLTADAGDEHNVFTVGNIDVSLDEEVGVIGDGGEVKETEEGAEYTEVMPGDYLKKEVTVTNNGKTPAYVAVTVTLNNADKINAAIDGVYEEAPYNYTAEQIQAIYDDIFDGWGINYNPRPGAAGVNDARGVIDGTYGLPAHTLHVDFAKTTAGSTVIGANNWFVAGKEVAGQYWVDGPAEYDGYYTKDMEDYEICYTYYMLLPAGASSTLFNGLNVPAKFDAAQLAMFAGLEIDIEAKAIQADNMAVATQYANDANGKAKTAFAILAGDIETPEYSSKPSGSVTAGHTSETTIWGEATTNAKQSVVIKIYSGNTYMGETSLNNIDNIINGTTRTVTWNIALDGVSTDYWTMRWDNAPTVTLQPTDVELWVDGVKTDAANVKLNNSGDDLKPVSGAVVDANGKILRYVFNDDYGTLNAGEEYVKLDPVSNDTNLDEAIKNGQTTIILGDGNYIIPDSAKGKTLTIIGNGDTVIAVQDDGSYEGCDYSLEGSTVTFKNVTINTDSSTYTGYARLNATYENCTINGSYTLYGESVFNNCTFNVSGDAYNIWTWGAGNVSFTDCTFNSDGKSILVYNQTCDVSFNDCVFNDNKGLSDLKAAIETGVDGVGPKYNIYVNNTVVNGYEVNDKGSIAGTLVGNKNNMTNEYLNVVVDGKDVY